MSQCHRDRHAFLYVIIAGITDMRCGFNGLASKVQNTLKDDPFSGHIFVFRGRSGKM
ncbi:IS66 family insertion sequence element accessory protein TnpB, partial [Shigella flexneri]|uniref:IS66 family insertion sequence element accessory protein TnpB n=1 Tax=Shigella flexneri TaxID=623 RepID=UPI00202972E1